jgi:hypothetical protein
MSGRASPLGLRLFLEGIEVPVISAQVNIAPDQPATAAIQIIPTDMALALLPRTLVHLFYLDRSDIGILSSTSISQSTAKSGSTEWVRDNPEDARGNALDTDYKIFFAGEVLGYTYSKTPDSRQIILQCMDLSSYWDTCYQFFSDYSVNGNGLTDKVHQFVGAGSGNFDNVASGTQWVIARLLNTSPRSKKYQQCQGLLGGLIHVLECVGGIRDGIPGSGAPNGYNGVNDFFSIAELRYNLIGMIGAIAEDTTSKRIFDHHAFIQWMRNGMTSLGSLISFRDIVTHINKYIFHNIYPNPCAFYVPEGEGSATVSVKVDMPQFTDTVSGLQAVENMVLIWECARAAQRVYEKIGTLAVYMDVTPAIAALNEAQKHILGTEALLGGIRTPDIANVKTNFAAATSALDEAMKVGPGGGIVHSKSIAAGDFSTTAHAAGKYCETAVDTLENLIGPVQRSKRSVKKSVSVQLGGHLYNQLFLPETFFVAPPRCNIIFPDQYNMFQYSRNFAREITRLACQGGLGIIAGGAGMAKVFGHYYFAPNIKDVRGKTLGATLSSGARVLLPHEVHAGIIPKLEWVTDGHRWGVKAAGANAAQKPTSEQKIHYIQRLANFQFFLHRWSSRSMSLQGIFMPHLVCGLPGAIIDRSAPSPAVIDALKSALNRNLILPTQYLGKIVNITHMVGQQGASTSVAYAYARTHRGVDDEFLGAMSREIMTEGAATKESIDVKELASNPKSYVKNREWYKRLVSMHIQQKLHPQAVVNRKKITVVVPGALYPSTVEEVVDTLGVPMSVFEANSTEALGLITMQIPSTLQVTWIPLIKTGQFVRSDLAFEDQVRPGWMQENIWANANISDKVYKPLLGTVAITDDTSLGAQQQSDLTQSQKTDSEQAVAVTAIPGLSTNEAQGSGYAEGSQVPGGSGRYIVAVGSVEETIDGLSVLYGLMKSKGSDIHDFIRQFTYRPTANIVDMLGSDDLAFTPTGDVVDPTNMTEGFHSRAFGDYNTDVKRAERAGDQDIPGLNSLGNLMRGVPNPGALVRPNILDRLGPPTRLDPMLDPRGRAGARVDAYVKELRVSRGMMG